MHMGRSLFINTRHLWVHRDGRCAMQSVYGKLLYCHLQYYKHLRCMHLDCFMFLPRVLIFFLTFMAQIFCSTYGSPKRWKFLWLCLCVH